LDRKDELDSAELERLQDAGAAVITMYEEELDRLEEVLNNLMLEPEKELRVAVKRQRKDSDDDEAEEPESKKIKTEEV
jgi:hypothetical protein